VLAHGPAQRWTASELCPRVHDVGSSTTNARGGLRAVAFALTAIVGLALWFGGANMPENDSSDFIAKHLNNKTIAVIGAIVIIGAMLILISYARWLASAYPSDSLVKLGAAALGLGGLTHVVENILVTVLFSGDVAGHDGMWHTTQTLSHVAFGLLGFGALLVAIGLQGPTWLRLLGGLAGVGGLCAAVEKMVPGLSFIAGPFNILLLAFLIALGFRTDRRTTPIHAGR
jgi:hypothetical protein